MKNCFFTSTVSAICYTQALDRSDQTPFNDVVRFVLQQWGLMTDYLRFPIFLLTCLFSVSSVLRTGRFFYQLDQDQRLAQINCWKSSRLQFRRDLIRFYESLGALALYGRA